MDKLAVFEVQNLVTAPATDEVLVDALLAFVSGHDIVISGQRSRPDVREAYIESVLCAMHEPHKLLPMVQINGTPWPAAKALELAAAGDAKPPLPTDFYRSVASIQVEQVLVAVQSSPRGYSLAFFTRFPDVEAALARALLLLLDVRRPYGKRAARCKLPSCLRFYLARSRPKGGPVNRVFCSSDHGTEYRNSAERKALERARKHK